MFKYLPSKVYNALIDAIDNGAPLESQYCRRGSCRHEEMGHRNGCYSLYALVRTTDRKAQLKNMTLSLNMMAKAV